MRPGDTLTHCFKPFPNAPVRADGQVKEGCWEARERGVLFDIGHGAGSFDFAVAEDCQVYSECGAYRRLYGGHVIEIEYSDEGRANFDSACDARGHVWSIVYRDRDLLTPGQHGYAHATC